jgi:hypothetical protein
VAAVISRREAGTAAVTGVMDWKRDGGGEIFAADGAIG